MHGDEDELDDGDDGDAHDGEHMIVGIHFVDVLLRLLLGIEELGMYQNQIALDTRRRLPSGPG